MKPIILIPTYNEAETILDLLQELEELHRRLDFDVLIIDDNSPDGTADLVDSVDYPFVRFFIDQLKVVWGLHTAPE